MTYLQAYEEHLLEVINAGGAQAKVDAAVDQYNRPSLDRVAAWLATAKITCPSCGKTIETTGIDPDDEIECPSCK